MPGNCQASKPVHILQAVHWAWVAVVVTVIVAFSDPVQAQGTPRKPLAAYPSEPKDCYQLLKKKLPSVQGGDHPVCMPVLKNLNRFCDQSPQYDQRHLHPESSELQAPAWMEVPVMQNMDIVKETYLAANQRKYREPFWGNEQERVTRLAYEGKLKLFNTNVDLNVNLGPQAVYKLEGYYATSSVPAGYLQPRLMFTSDPTSRVGSDLMPPSFDTAADLWRFEQGWYLIHFDPIEKRFVVKEMTRTGRGSDAMMDTPTRCTIMYMQDNR
jgi:hypothetical protein